MKVFLVVLAFVVLMPIVAWAGHSARHPRERPDYAGEGYRGPNDYRTPTPYPQAGESLLRPYGGDSTGRNLLAPTPVWRPLYPSTQPGRGLLDDE